MIKIISKRIDDSVEFSIEDGENNLGMKFSIKQDELASEGGLEKTLDFIASYLNQNYVSMHEKRQMSSYFNQNGNKI